MIKISVITVNYNNAEGLEKTLNSVLEQVGFTDMEYIVIDGASTDNSVEIIKSFAPHLSYWSSTPDNGVYEAMNKGIDRATGDYLIFLNSGDVFYSENTLAEVSSRIDGAKDIYFGDLIFVHNGKELHREYPSEFDFSYFLERSLPHPGSFIKRTLFDSVFRYSEHYRIVSDWEFFIYAILKEKVPCQHLGILISRFELDGMSNDPANKERIEQERYDVIKQRFPEHLEDYEAWRDEKLKKKRKSNRAGFFSKVKRKLRRL